MYAGGKTREGSWGGKMEGWTRKRKQHTQTWCFTNVWTHHWRGMEVFKVAATRWLLAQRNTYTQLKRCLKKYTLCGSSPLVSAYRILVPAFVAKASAQRTARCEREDGPFWGQMFDKRDLKKGGWWAERVCVSLCVLCDPNATRRSVFEWCPRVSDICTPARTHTYPSPCAQGQRHGLRWLF